MMMKVFHGGDKVRVGDEGSALVELALSLPLLSLMLLGAVEFARVAYASIEVANAAHSAVVYAASSPTASSDTTGIGNAATSDSQNLFGGSAVSVSSVSTACTCANTSYTPSSCSDNNTCQSNNTAMITTVTVKTQATYSPLLRIPRGGLSFTLYGQSSQVVTNQ
jgi:Flp pilus assembly protein TadG